MNCAGVIFAGGKAETSLERRFGVPYKALIPFRGRRLADYAITALTHTPEVTRVFIFLPPDCPFPALPEAVVRKDASAKLFENVMEALRSCAESPYLLLASADAPLITSATLRTFLRSADSRPGYSVYYPIVLRSVIEQRVPGARRTYVRLTDGVFTGGNVLLVEASAVRKVLPAIDDALALRKKPFRLARRLGLSTLLRLLTGRLSISEIEATVERVVGLRAAALPLVLPEIAMDIDRAKDYDDLLLLAEPGPDSTPGD